MSDFPLADAIRRVRARIAEAARRVGRDPAEIGLVAVTKGIGADSIRLAASAGITCIGESRLQEAMAKAAELADRGLEWHLIGHLQRNKVPQAVGRFALFHGVDSEPLMEAVSDRALRSGIRQRILLQINVAADPGKHGFSPAELAPALDKAAGLDGIQVDGLMTIPALDPEPEAARSVFHGLRELRDRVAPGLKELSMGMSGDFEVAIEEGSTMVRVGSAIFGARAYAN